MAQILLLWDVEVCFWIPLALIGYWICPQYLFNLEGELTMELVKQAPLNLSYFSFAATLLLTMACSNHDKVKPPVAIAPGAVDSEASSENGKPAADQMSPPTIYPAASPLSFLSPSISSRDRSGNKDCAASALSSPSGSAAVWDWQGTGCFKA